MVKRQVVSRSKPSTKSKKVKRRRTTVGPSARSRLTPAGTAFTKCTLAPADFQDTGFSGIPDEYDGQVISKKHTLVGSLPSYTTGHDLYIVQLPTPGVAYWYGDRAAGSTTAITLTAVPYDDSATLFPTGAEDQNVSSFRYASNVLEFVPTVNSMTWGGAIEVWKSKVMQNSAVTSAGGGLLDTDYIEGLAQSLNTKKPMSVFALKDGAYCPAYNAASTYEWVVPRTNFTYASLTTNQALAPTIDATITFSGATVGYVGLGSFETTIMKFPAIIAAQTGMLRAWACVEYQVSPTSIIYDYAHMSPTYDPVALAMVKAFHKTRPCAVPWKDNASFWEEFRRWAGIASEAASYLPGPIGLIGKGFNSFFKSSAFGKGGLFR